MIYACFFKMIYAFYRNLADRLICKSILYPFALFLLLSCWQTEAYGRSAFSPRHSGMEPPGGPRPLENMPARSLGQSPDGGRGYTDAYGNRIENPAPAEGKKYRRQRVGGSEPAEPGEKGRPLPDPGAMNDSPVWKF